MVKAYIASAVAGAFLLGLATAALAVTGAKAQAYYSKTHAQ